MALKQCLMKWNGQVAEGGGSFTWRGGITPSVATLRFRLAYQHQPYGTLTITDGRQSLNFPNCRVKRAVTLQSGGGPRWNELTIMDRRWKWAEEFQAVYGEYNVDLAGKKIKRSRRQLASLLLNALGESRFDVSALPEHLTTSVKWYADNPATELMRICETNGCVVTINRRDRVRIVTKNVGNRPDLGQRAMDNQSGVEPAVVPALIVFEGGDTWVQHDLPLEAVGKETAESDEWIKIEDLSYKPDGGWIEQPLSAPDPFPGVTDKEKRKLARAFVWRAFRIRIPKGGIQLPAPPQELGSRQSRGRLEEKAKEQIKRFFKLQEGELWRILPLNERKLLIPKEGTSFGVDPGDVEPFNALVNGKEPEVYGYFYEDVKNRNTNGVKSYDEAKQKTPDFFDHDKLCTGSVTPSGDYKELGVKGHASFSLLREDGVVLFDQIMKFVRIIDEQTGQARNWAPDLRLRVSFPLRDRENGVKIAQQLGKAPPAAQRTNVIRLHKEDDVNFQLVLADRGVLNNLPDWRETANQFIEDELRTIQPQVGYNVPYKGFIFDREPDGFCRAITWTVSPTGGGSTMIDYGLERPRAYLTTVELQNRREAKAAAKAEKKKRRERNAKENRRAGRPGKGA